VGFTVKATVLGSTRVRFEERGGSILPFTIRKSLANLDSILLVR
jgi:hypothetical protein